MKQKKSTPKSITKIMDKIKKSTSYWKHYSLIEDLIDHIIEVYPEIKEPMEEIKGFIITIDSELHDESL